MIKILLRDHGMHPPLFQEHERIHSLVRESLEEGNADLHVVANHRRRELLVIADQNHVLHVRSAALERHEGGGLQSLRGLVDHDEIIIAAAVENVHAGPDAGSHHDLGRGFDAQS